MTTIHLDIPEVLYDNILSTFLGEEAAVANFAIAAMQEWEAWLFGEDRSTSVSEIETKRIYRVYERILVNELPTMNTIGELFNLPLGRARYIVQNLNYRYPIFMRRRKFSVALVALENFKLLPSGLHLVSIQVECRDLLDEAISELIYQEALNAHPSRAIQAHLALYEMGGRDRNRILEYLQQQAQAEFPQEDDDG